MIKNECNITLHPQRHSELVSESTHAYNTDVINVLVQSSLLSIRLNIFINRHYQSRNYNTLFGLFVISLWYNHTFYAMGHHEILKQVQNDERGKDVVERTNHSNQQNHKRISGSDNFLPFPFVNFNHFANFFS